MSASGGGELVFPRELRERLEAWARASYPLEACGLLLGRPGGEVDDGGVRVEVLDVSRTVNSVGGRARDRFEIAPGDFAAAERAALDAGRAVVGVWHTHPDDSATPSETDRASAWPDWTHVIVSLRLGRVGEIRAWRILDRRVREVRLLDSNALAPG